jgi:spermidine/putrescine transport system permease protein
MLTRQKDIRRFPSFGTMAVICVTFLYGPIFFLMAYSFNEGRSISIWSGFSFRWYIKVFNNEDIQAATLNSLLVAAIAASIATILAIGAALATTRHNKVKRSNVAYAFLNLPLIVPEIVSAVALLVFFVLIGLKLGLLSVIIAHTMFCIPFAYLPIRARLMSLDAGLEAAATDLYASPIQAFFHVHCHCCFRVSLPDSC